MVPGIWYHSYFLWRSWWLFDGFVLFLDRRVAWCEHVIVFLCMVVMEDIIVIVLALSIVCH